MRDLCRIYSYLYLINLIVIVAFVWERAEIKCTMFVLWVYFALTLNFGGVFVINAEKLQLVLLL